MLYSLLPKSTSYSQLPTPYYLFPKNAMTRKLLSLLFSAAVLIGAVGCFEEKLPEQNLEPFVPVEPGERLQRYCQVLCLNTEDGELSPVEQQIYDDLQGAKQKKLSKESLDKLASDTKEKMLDLSVPKPIERFTQLYQNVPAKVTEAMTNANIRNLSVFLVKVDTNFYAIRTFEYIGKNFEQDWLDLTRNPDFVEWNNACEECQMPVVGKTEAGGLIQWSLDGNEIMYLPLTKTGETVESESAVPAPLEE